jgi:ParB family chromosome partitioning protein
LKNREEITGHETSNKKPQMGYELKQVQEKLSSHFGSRVLIYNDKNNRGSIKIPYLSHEDLNRILEILDL